MRPITEYAISPAYSRRGSELWLDPVTSFKPQSWLKRVFSSRADKKRPSPFHAVEIRCTGNACQAAQDSRGERYVSAEAPRLPLDKCDQSDRCQCIYQHYDDRRGDSRRDAESGFPAQGESAHVEQRKAKGRRAADVAEGDEPCSVSEDSYYEYVGNNVHDPSIDTGESAGIDPYNSGSFDKSKSWKSSSRN